VGEKRGSDERGQMEEGHVEEQRGSCRSEQKMPTSKG